MLPETDVDHESEESKALKNCRNVSRGVGERAVRPRRQSHREVDSDGGSGRTARRRRERTMRQAQSCSRHGDGSPTLCALGGEISDHGYLGYHGKRPEAKYAAFLSVVIRDIRGQSIFIVLIYNTTDGRQADSMVVPSAWARRRGGREKGGGNARNFRIIAIYR